MLGLQLVWCLCCGDKPIIAQDVRYGLGRLIVQKQDRVNEYIYSWRVLKFISAD